MNLYLSAYAGGGHYNDMDMLLIGCDLTRIPEESLNLLRNEELIALNQDPLGLQAYIVQHEGGGYVLVKDIEQKRGKVRAVALYNPSDSVCSFRVPLEILELAGKTRVRDLVKRKDEGRVTGSFQYDVPAHGVKILRVEGEERLEPVRYEAEQAYLHQFDNLAKRPRGVAYLPYEGASGGMLVTNLGGHRDNYARWNEVFSEEGGRYRMTVCYPFVRYPFFCLRISSSRISSSRYWAASMKSSFLAASCISLRVRSTLRLS